MPSITKRKFLEARKCLTRGRYLHNIGESAPTEAERYRMDQGTRLGELARSLLPGGVLVENRSTTEAVERINRLLADPSIPAIFEGAFHVDGYTARADLLERLQKGWHVLEVKSSLDTVTIKKNRKKLEALIDDLTYTVMVARRSGLDVRQASLVVISKDYRTGMPTEKLFTALGMTEAVNERLPAFEELWDTIKGALAGETPPEPELIPLCRNCEYFKTHCLGVGVTNPIFELSRLHPSTVKRFRNAGIRDVSEIPDDFDLSKRLGPFIQSVKTGEPILRHSLRKKLERINWPAYYLDFETTQGCPPLYPNTKPYEAVLTQFSIHRCDSLGDEPKHFEYLADPTQDCRRELVEQLLEHLGTSGSILAYSGYEGQQIKQLARLLPDLKPALRAVRKRLKDLMQIIQKGYYHPEFRGSYSIKRILPVLVPDLSYDGLPIADGDTATIRFAELARGNGDHETVRRDLLAYCKLDTLAMVRLHKRMWELAAR